MQPLDAGLNDVFIPPTHQPVSCGSIEEEMLSRSFPNKVPGKLRINSNWAAAMRIGCMEGAVK
jgi:hypothetical protein